MQIDAAAPSDVAQAVDCLAAAFAEDPITSFLLHAGSNYREHLTHFFSLLARAHRAWHAGACGSSHLQHSRGGHGQHHRPPPWPSEFEDAWSLLELATPGFNDRAALYDEIAKRSKPPVPHYYLGVIGMDPAMQGSAWGRGCSSPFAICRYRTRFQKGFTWKRPTHRMSGSTSAPALPYGPRQPRQCNPMVHVPVPPIPHDA